MQIAKFCHLTFFFSSIVLLSIVGYQSASINVELYAKFLEESNLSWAQIKAEKEEIDNRDKIFIG